MIIPVDYPALWGTDRDRQNAAYESLMAETRNPVPWAADVWDDVVLHLEDGDNHNRAIAAQLLCNLAATDPGGRIFGADLDALLQVTRDPRTVTARHSLKSLWRIGLAGEPSRRRLLDVLAQRYRDTFDAAEKHPTLVRGDLAETLRLLHDATGDDAVRELAQQLIASEPDEKYRKKYAKFWK
ncbi:hypothetical protein [Actinoplanes sp. NPDC023714]|uniref:hypothetical protein n=1 Tax=Actinoplanes sp. NPDC023714 TaxID=3154322 RepID=UPI0033C28300